MRLMQVSLYFKLLRNNVHILKCLNEITSEFCMVNCSIIEGGLLENKNGLFNC